MTSPLEVVAKYSVGQLAALVAKVGDDNVPAILRGEVRVVIKQPDLLSRVTTVTVASTEKFIADKNTLKQANIGWTGDNFKKFFANKVEENIQGITLAVNRLEKASLDPPILTELGDKAETTFVHMLELIKKQSKGEAGVLLANGYANVAYIKGNDGNLWAVGADWRSGYGYWNVEANSVGLPGRWPAGDQILSRDS